MIVIFIKLNLIQLSIMSDSESDISDDLSSNIEDDDCFSDELEKCTTGFKLIVTTCKAITNSYINLNLIARKLKLIEPSENHNGIVGKKMDPLIIEGEIKPKLKPKIKKQHLQTDQHVSEKKEKKRNDFSNQLTLIIDLYNHNNKLGNDEFYNNLLQNAIVSRRLKNLSSNIPESRSRVNLKIFGNGKIMITGGLSVDECQEAIKIFQREVVDLTDYLHIDKSCTIDDLFPNVSNYIKYLKKFHLHILKLFSIFDINLNLNIHELLNKKKIEEFEINGYICNINLHKISSIINHIIVGEPSDIDNYVRLLQAFNIICLYYPDTFLLDKLNNEDGDVINLIEKLYMGEIILMPSTFTPELFLQDAIISVENYNTLFSTNFNIDRDALTQIICNKYRNDKMDKATFDPSKYQGIKAKYISRVGCSESCKSKGSKKSSCPCKKISFLIFQNKTMVTGGRLWEQIIDGYTTIKNIIETEYENICIKLNIDSSLTLREPTEIVVDENLYVNKKKLVFENPRNMMLLKKYNLFHYFNKPIKIMK